MQVDSEYVEEYIYAQTFRQSGDGQGAVRVTNDNKAVTEYATGVVNDANFEVFYKAICYTTQDGYVISFFAFKAVTLTSQDLVSVRDKHLPHLTQEGITLLSEKILTQSHGIKRKPVYTGEETHELGWENVPGNNCCTKFLNWWLIVPKVQWEFFNLLYQMYTFDITHQGFLPKFVHFFTIPCNVMLSMCFLAQFRFFGIEKRGYGAFELNASLILFLILIVLYLIMGLIRKTLAWGLATTVVLFVCWVTGNLWYTVYKTPENPWYNPTTIGTNPILWSYIISFIQAGSHMCVPQLPPYITGVEHWESLHTFFCTKYESAENSRKSRCFIIMSLLGFPILSVAVAWFSWPHLIGTQVIYIMAGIGYQHSSFDKFFRVIEKSELSGNPGLDHFPKTTGDLEQPVPHNDITQSPVAHKLRHYGLISDNASSNEVAKTICSMKLAHKYFKPNVTNEDTHHMKHARQHLHYA